MTHYDWRTPYDEEHRLIQQAEEELRSLQLRRVFLERVVAALKEKIELMRKSA